MGKARFLRPCCSVYPAGTMARLTFYVTDASLAEKLRGGCAFAVKYVREDWADSRGEVHFAPGSFWEELPARFEDGAIHLNVFLSGENEHIFRIELSEAGIDDPEYIVLYSLLPDLFELRPFKGNLHCHSHVSDGSLSPEEVLEHSREAGFDFIALTEHGIHSPERPELAPFEFACYPGEEVHPLPPSCSVVHVLSLGTEKSVCRWMREHPDEYERSVADWERHYPALSPYERHFMAVYNTVFDKIREYGGLSVLAHPYWKTLLRYNATPALNDLLFAEKRFDALELGNREIYRTALMNARLTELAGAGFKSPLIGASDYHGRVHESLKSTYTIVFAKDLSRDSIFSAIRAGHCVAVAGSLEEVPFGSFRLVKYALFLQEYYFPPHDKLCADQSKLLFSGGTPENSPIQIAEKIRTFRENFFL